MARTQQEIMNEITAKTEELDKENELFKKYAKNVRKLSKEREQLLLEFAHIMTKKGNK